MSIKVFYLPKTNFWLRPGFWCPGDVLPRLPANGTPHFKTRMRRCAGWRLGSIAGRTDCTQTTDDRQRRGRPGRGRIWRPVEEIRAGSWPADPRWPDPETRRHAAVAGGALAATAAELWTPVELSPVGWSLTERACQYRTRSVCAANDRLQLVKERSQVE